MNINTVRVNQLRERCGFPRFSLGAAVRDSYGNTGRVDAVYADLAAAVDSAAVSRDWYEVQSRKPKTPKESRWYSIVTNDGAILAGEDDLESA